MSNCYVKLCSDYPDVAVRYKEKLKAVNSVDPFELDNTDFSINPANFPPVTNMDLVSYLVLTTSYYTSLQMKAYKSLNSYKYFEAGFVTDCRVVKVNDHFILKGKVI